ncbi:hypothetical protein [Cerasicoccus frondis]|nr:hypothetical protein [Cerasicoccus frondis]
MGPFRLTPQEARTLTVLLLILLAGLMGLMIWGNEKEPEDNMAIHQAE